MERFDFVLAIQERLDAGTVWWTQPAPRVDGRTVTAALPLQNRGGFPLERGIWPRHEGSVVGREAEMTFARRRVKLCLSDKVPPSMKTATPGSS